MLCFITWQPQARCQRLQDYPGRKNPLDGVSKMQATRENPGGGTGMFQYFLKVSDAVLDSVCMQYNVQSHSAPACRLAAS